MARETKVGLLAGLAFIICFAVILANRGAKGPPGLANSFLPEGALQLPKLVQRNQGATVDPLANANRNRTGPASRPPVQRPSTNPALSNATTPQNPLLGVNEPAPPTGAQLPPARNHEGTRLHQESALAQNTRPVEVPSPKNVNAELERALTSSPGLDSVLRSDPQVRMTATADPALSPGRVAHNETEIQGSTKNQQVVEGTPYTVKVSDTLSSIASAHYGTRSKQAIETIFDANRSVLTDMDHVKLGTVLTIPKLPGMVAEKNQLAAKIEPDTKPAPAPDAEKIADAKAKNPEKQSPKKEAADKVPVKKVADTLAESDKNAKNFKWYQVKKNDRFASIARDQLGDAGRWQEVYELNKDKFPDPQKIREGVRIKLPAPVVLAAAGKESKERKH
jgi:nucleoid-associated protein YgaU